MKSALVLIDIQNDYFPGGAMTLSGADAAAAHAARLLAAFRERGLPVFHIQHLALRPGATFFLPGTAGADIHAAVAPAAGERVIVKHYPNSFRETPLDAELRAAGVEHLVVAGMMTHLCIDTGVRAAADLGYRISLAGDACATRDLAYAGRTVAAADVQAAFLAALGQGFCAVDTAAALAAAPAA